MHIKIFFVFYIIIGFLLGFTSLLFLPRWEYFDKLYMGLGLCLPIILFHIIVAGILFYIDSSGISYKLGKLCLTIISSAVAMYIIISSIKIGF